jgi:outer membrane lipase/esterase
MGQSAAGGSLGPPVYFDCALLRPWICWWCASALGYRASFDWRDWHPFVWNHEFDPLNRLVTAASLTTIAAPSYSLPAVVLGRDWATATVGTEVRIDRSWTGLASFTAQLSQQNVTNFGALIGLNYAFGAGPRAGIYKN